MDTVNQAYTIIETFELSKVEQIYLSRTILESMEKWNDNITEIHNKICEREFEFEGSNDFSKLTKLEKILNILEIVDVHKLMIVEILVRKIGGLKELAHKIEVEIKYS